MNILAYLQGQGRHSIDVLLAIFTLTEQHQRSVGWKEVNKWVRENTSEQSFSDGTYRARRQELLTMGLVELEPIDDLKSKVKMTEKGREVALLIKEFTEKMKTTENQK